MINNLKTFSFFSSIFLFLLLSLEVKAEVNMQSMVINCNSPLKQYSAEENSVASNQTMDAFTLYVDIRREEFALVPIETALIRGRVLNINKDVIILYLVGDKEYLYAYFLKNKSIVVVNGKTPKDISNARFFFSGTCDHTSNK